MSEWREDYVDVYFNLHKKLWSIKNCQTGRLMGHSNFVRLKDVKFVVQPAGRAKVLKEKRKNVHAFVRGTMLIGYKPDDFCPIPPKHYLSVNYNPYMADHFYYCDNMQQIDEANNAWMTIRNKTPSVKVPT